jgi:hypothetical protein
MFKIIETSKHRSSRGVIFLRIFVHKAGVGGCLSRKKTSKISEEKLNRNVIEGRSSTKKY